MPVSLQLQRAQTNRMGEIARQDLRSVNYAEFGQMLTKLTEAVVTGGENYTLVVPILRSGGFSGLHIASKLRITNILPAQYKTVPKPSVHLTKKFDFPELTYDVGEMPHILVTDTNTVSGNTARQVIEDLQKKWPAAAIDFATICLDQALLQAPVGRNVYYAALSNEARHLSATEATERSISNDILIFPWENLDEQWQEIQALRAS
jgi:hypoxanthine phosphoribosyltransferase